MRDWYDEFIYQIIVARFITDDFNITDDEAVLAHHLGGDWMDRSGYCLEAIGVTALWISPMVLNLDVADESLLRNDRRPPKRLLRPSPLFTVGVLQLSSGEDRKNHLERPSIVPRYAIRLQHRGERQSI